MKAPRKLQLPCLVLAVTSLCSAAPPQSQSSDEAALVALITNYYAAYSKKDLGALVLYWSQRSPDLRAGIEEALQAMERGGYSASDVSVSRIKVADNKAILQASAFFASSDPKTNAKRIEKRTRNFALIKDGGNWKVWRDADNSQDLSAFLEKGSEWKVSADSLEQFAVALVNASEPERDRLLADNRKMITTDLRDALTRKAGPLQIPGSYERAVSLLRLVQKISEQLGDKAGIAAAERQMGDVFRGWGRWADALKHYLDAAALYDAIGRRTSRAAALISAGQVYFAQKNHKLAIETYEKALAEFESLNSTRAIADTLEELASVYYDQEAAGSPESENEVKSLERFYTAAKSKVYVGMQASETLLKQEAGKFNVIHFAAPALLSDANPLFSYVALSQSEGHGNDDGLLEVREILKLNLSADLVLLSSSEAARDKYATGGAMSSLAWSLFIAGCPSSVIGRWGTGSPSTTEVMLELHRSLQSASTPRTAVSKAKNLQHSMLRVLRGGQYQHPFYWAGFSLVGDFR